MNWPNIYLLFFNPFCILPTASKIPSSLLNLFVISALNLLFFVSLTSEQNRTEIYQSSMFDMHIAVKRKTITRDKINYSKKQANIKYYNAKVFFFFFFSKTYTYLINKLEHIKFITKLASEKSIFLVIKLKLPIFILYCRIKLILHKQQQIKKKSIYKHKKAKQTQYNTLGAFGDF